MKNKASLFLWAFLCKTAHSLFEKPFYSYSSPSYSPKTIGEKEKWQ